MSVRGNVLIVCTANVCRSPVAERLLARYAGEAGHDLTVTSAGTLGGQLSVHPDTVRAAAEFDVDLRDHVSRKLSAELIATEGADLIITMTKKHQRDVAAVDIDAWPRTFTLHELVRRAFQVSMDVDGLAAWTAAASAGRRGSELIQPTEDEDLADPYGAPLREHREMVAQVDELTRRAARLLPR